MSVRVEVSEVIDRPVAAVFQFHAIEHVRNHPRWDPDMELEQVTDGPMDVGTIIKRINSRSGAPVEGTMEVVEFERDHAVAMVIQDGPMQMNARATYEPVETDRTRLSYDVELVGVDEDMDTDVLASQMQRSLRNIKKLIESEN